MKGIVFNLLEEAVTTEFGPGVWDKLLEAVHTDGAYTSLGTYPDEQVVQMVGAASRMLGREPADVLRWFGKAAIPVLFERYPQFFSPYLSARDLLLHVNLVIHPEVVKIYPGAVVPWLEFTDAEDGGLLMRYDSPRKLCALAEGFTAGAAAHFDQTMTFTHRKCMLLGDDACLCHMTFSN